MTLLRASGLPTTGQISGCSVGFEIAQFSFGNFDFFFSKLRLLHFDFIYYEFIILLRRNIWILRLKKLRILLYIYIYTKFIKFLNHYCRD